MASKLTQNSIYSIYNEESDGRAELQTPVLQILNVKKFTSSSAAASTSAENSSERFRLLLSDGKYYMNGMVPLNVCPGVASGDVGKDTIVRLLSWTMSAVNGRKILLVLNMEVVENCAYGRIGEPQNIEASDGKAPAKQPVAAPAQVLAQQKPQQPQQLQQMSKAQASAPKPQTSAAPQYSGQGSSKGSSITDSNPFPNAVMPIKSINPYQNKWTLKVRVVNKTELRTWANAKGEGKLFSVNLIDESGEIKATAFNDTALKLYPLFEENKVYYVTKGQVKSARKQFSNVQNDFEITMENSTEVVPCNDVSVPTLRFNFIPIERLSDFQKDSIIDIIAVVKEMGEVQTIVSKATQRQMVKRELTLVDQTNASVNLTIWGKHAEQPEFGKNAVVSFKGVKVSDFNGVSLSTLSSTSSMINPDIPEAHRLRGWFDSVGSNLETTSLSTPANSKRQGGVTRERKHLCDIQNEHMGQNEKPDWINVRVMTGLLKGDKNMWYASCPGDGCQKKVIEENGEWRCEKCQRSYSHCEYRYIMNMPVQDFTSQAWVQCFNEVGDMILGHTANELNQLKESDNIDAFTNVLQNAANKMYVVTLRIKQEIYNDEARVRSAIQSCDPINFVEESNYLANLIEQYF